MKKYLYVYHFECNYYIQNTFYECNIECSNTNIEKFWKSLRKEKRLKIAKKQFKRLVKSLFFWSRWVIITSYYFLWYLELCSVYFLIAEQFCGNFSNFNSFEFHKSSSSFLLFFKPHYFLATQLRISFCLLDTVLHYLFQIE